MVVDDAHWADIPSLRFLSFLVPRLEELPVALVVAARLREALEQAALLESLAADAAAETVAPAPLSPRASRSCWRWSSETPRRRRSPRLVTERPAACRSSCARSWRRLRENGVAPTTLPRRS